MISNELFEMTEEKKLKLAEELVRSTEAKPSATLAAHLKRASQYAYCAEAAQGKVSAFKKEMLKKHEGKYPSLKQLTDAEWKELFNRAEAYI